jgi:hypothetical protein
MSEQDIYTGDDIGIIYPKDGSDAGTEAGASGQDKGGGISQGGMIAIIVVVVTVSVIGSTLLFHAVGVAKHPFHPHRQTAGTNHSQTTVVSAVLFYVAKKREWKVRESIRRSAKKVVTALTPRRSEFPRELKDGGGPRSKRRARLDDVPPTPRLRPEDLEKGMGGAGSKRGMKKMRFGGE